MSKPVFQSSLGTVNNNSGRAGKTWNDGSLNIGRVTKMHHKRATADTQVIGGPNEILSNEDQEGRNGPIMCSRYAGFDPEYKKPYGEFIPLQENDRPLFVYAENNKTKPFIVGMLHHTDEKVEKKNRKDILPSDYPIDPADTKEALREIWIHRTQDGFTRDGNGEIEASSHTKAFFKTWNDVHEDEDIDEETFDYEDLHLKDKGEPVREDHDESYHQDCIDPEIEDLGDAEYDEEKTIFLPEQYSSPLKYLGVVRNKYKDDETDYLRLFLNAEDLTSKINRQQKEDKKSTNFQVKDDGSIVLRRQLDDYKTDEGEKYTQAELKEDGEILVQNRVTETQNDYIQLKDDTILIRRQLDSNEVGAGAKYTYAIIDSAGTFQAENHIGGIPALVKLEEEKATINVGQATEEMTNDHILLTIGPAKIEMTQDHIMLTIGGSRINMTSGDITINAPKVYIN